MFGCWRILIVLFVIGGGVWVFKFSCFVVLRCGLGRRSWLFSVLVFLMVRIEFNFEEWLCEVLGVYLVLGGWVYFVV